MNDDPELDELLEGMTVPAFRLNDLGWLRRNLHIDNADHPNLTAARQRIRILSRQIERGSE